MGMFSEVKIHPKYLVGFGEGYPSEGWQTKEVVEPILNTLEVTETGRLLYHEATFELDRSAPQEKIPFSLRRTGEMVKDTGYHGYFECCHLTAERQMIILRLKYTDGNLESVALVSDEVLS